MAPPLPPPGVPAWGGVAPLPMAWVSANTLLYPCHDTPMLERAAPFEHTLARSGLPPKVLSATMTGRPWDWLKTRRAAPPRSGPVGSQRLEVKLLSITLTRPPRTKTAPPPPP